MEKTISNKIIKYINSIPNSFARKRHTSLSSNTLGWPDITGSIYGIRIEIETKQPGKKPTKLQLNRLKYFQKLNCISFWCDSLPSAKKQLKMQIKGCMKEILNIF